MRFRTQLQKNTFIIDLGIHRRVILREVAFHEKYNRDVLEVTVQSNFTDAYKEEYSINKDDMDAITFYDAGEQVYNPFYDSDHTNIGNPIEFYGEQKVYEWLVELIMDVCVPQNLRE